MRTGLCLAALLLLPLLAFAQQPPVVTNAGLELDANQDGIPDGWGRYISNGTAQTSVDTQIKHAGVGALWMDCAADSRCTISQVVPLTAAGQYTFGCWLKTDLPAGASALVYIQWRKGKGETVSNEKPSPVLTGKQDWTEVSCVGTKPAEADAALLVIVVQTGQGAPGTAWADDAWLQPGAFPKGPPPPAAPTAPTAPAAVPAAPPGQLANPSFEMDADNDSQPDGWSKAIHGEGFELSRDATVAHTGDASMKMVGRPGAADRSAILQTSTPIATPKAVRVHVWYKGAGRADGILRYRPIPGVVVEMDTYGQRDFHIETPKNEWTEFTFDAPATEEALKAPQVRLEVILYQKGEGALWYDDVSLELLDKYTPKQTQADEVLQMPWRPAAGRVVLQNPPDFSWPPQPTAASYEFALSRDPQFPAGQTATARTPYNVYSHSATLAEGTWHWRMRYLDAGGTASEWSAPRPFVVTAAATPFPVPSPEDLLARIPQGHPRVYATAASLAAFRAPMQGAKKEWWEGFQGRLNNWLQKDTEKEPPGDWLMGARPGGGPLTDEDIQRGNKLRGYTGTVNTRLQDLAFGYLLSGDRKYADKAIAQMTEMATWDPLGVTSYKNQDQVFRDIAWMTATAYDWCYDVMTPEQRQTIRESVLVRARTLYKDFTGDSHSITGYPYDSHGITAYGYLGIIAIALAHETDEADGWFKFVAATYPALFPPWGGEEGGWSQGVGYWKWNQHFAWVFFDALKSATGLNMHDKAYCRNNGWYKLYMHPPWCDRHHFGDGNHGPPDSTDQSNMARYATEYRNPYFQWYARSLPYRLDFGLYSYWWHDDTVPAKPPADLPQGRYFPDIGWVAMHSDLSAPDDVMLMFKSSPYASYNHSHADQNSFVLYGYGEPLLIDSGYYDWYGSGHDVGFTRQTKAHNDILVNGEGQPIFDMTAKGQILRHFTSPAVDYTLGDATPAYKGKLTKFQRHILYLRPNGFLIIDDLEAPAESTFTWALHAEQEMKLRPEQQEVVVTRGNARCFVKFITPQGLKLEQTDQFTPPSVRKLANEWHTTATTTTKTKQVRFITFIRPAPLSEPEADLEVKAQFVNDLLLVAWGTTPTPGGVMTAWLGEGGFNASVVGPWTTGAVASVIDGRTLNLKDAQGEFQLLGADKPITATLELRGKDNATAQVRHVFYQAEADTPVELRVRDAVKTVTLDGQPLAASKCRWADEKLKLTLPAGEHVLRVNPEPQTATAPPVKVTLDGQPLTQALQAMPKWTGGALSWGSFAGPGQPVRLAQVQMPERSEVLVNNQPPQPGQLAWLGTDNSLSIRSDEPGPISLGYEKLLQNDQPVAMAAAEADAEKLPGAVKLEAEDYAQVGGGNFSRYTNRPFLSGGMGLGNWTVPGQWVQWQIKVPKDGKFRLSCKVATHEVRATRLITLDDQPLGSEYRLHEFAHTGGYGATPAEWRTVQLPEVLDLKAGTHTLKMMCLGGLLNVDWLVLAPE